MVRTQGPVESAIDEGLDDCAEVYVAIWMRDLREVAWPGFQSTYVSKMGEVKAASPQQRRRIFGQAGRQLGVRSKGAGAKRHAVRWRVYEIAKAV